MRGASAAGLLLALAARGVSAQPVPPQAAGTGRLSVLYQDPREPRYRPWKEALERRRFLLDAARDLNGFLIFPKNVSLVFAQCGRSGADYEPERSRLTLCYELIDKAAAAFAARAGYASDEPDKAVTALVDAAGRPKGTAGSALTTRGDAPETAWRKALYGALVFAAYHGLGHALLDVYSLPRPGREEDAADQLAALLLVDHAGPDAAAYALDAALLFGRLDRRQLTSVDFLQDHYLSPARLSDFVCEVYGRDPERWKDLPALGGLAAEQAKDCRRRFLEDANHWNTALFANVRDKEALAKSAEAPSAKKPPPLPVALSAKDEESMLVVLDTMRSKLTIFYADHGGRYPARLEELVKGGYIPSLPAAVTGRHPPSSAVSYVCGLADHPERAPDAGGWAYCADIGQKDYGTLRVDCAHLNGRRRPWLSF